MRRIASFGLACLVSLTLGGGCGKGNGDDDLLSAEEALDSTETVGGEGSLLTVAVDGTETVMKPGLAFAPTPETIAAEAATRMENVLQPPGCVTSTVEGATATYVLDDCTGPRGLVHVTGTLVVVYSLGLDGIHADATAEDLQVNGATVDIAAGAVYSVAAGEKSLTVATMGSGVGPLGNAISHTGDYTVTWTETCFTLDGMWSTTGPRGTRSTTISGFERCQGECPAAGGTISHTFVGGRTVTLTFDGSDVASWATSGGRSGTVNLPCGM